MRKIFSVALVAVICFIVSSCSFSASKIQSNLTKRDYSIIEIDENRLEELNNDLTYIYSGKGSIIYGFYAVHNESQKSVTVLEFSNKNDLTIMYKAVKETIGKDEAVDFSGYILVFGNADGVKTALK